MAPVDSPKQRRFHWRGLKTFLAVLVLYGVLALLSPEKTMEAAKVSLGVLEEILPILGVVVFFTAALHYWLDPRKLAKHLGEEGGLKGWGIALTAGILSHGPMYAWYPMIEDLRKHGLRDGYIAAFFYARAVKIPLLPIMIHYFGWAFTVFLSLYIVLGAWVQGILVERIEGRS